jgi:hypothetical protein
MNGYFQFLEVPGLELLNIDFALNFGFCWVLLFFTLELSMN